MGLARGKVDGRFPVESLEFFHLKGMQHVNINSGSVVFQRKFGCIKLSQRK